MPPARLLIVSLPPLLADVVRAVFADEAGVEVVAEVGAVEQDAVRVAEAVATHQADVVITCAHAGALSEPLRSLMYRFPLLHVLSLSADGRSAAVWRLVPEAWTVAEVGAGGLVEALRAVRGGAG